MHYISGDCLSILQTLKEVFVDGISSLKDILDKFINLRDLQLVLRLDPSQQKKVHMFTKMGGVYLMIEYQNRNLAFVVFLLLHLFLFFLFSFLGRWLVLLVGVACVLIGTSTNLSGPCTRKSNITFFSCCGGFQFGHEVFVVEIEFE